MAVLSTATTRARRAIKKTRDQGHLFVKLQRPMAGWAFLNGIEQWNMSPYIKREKNGRNPFNVVVVEARTDFTVDVLVHRILAVLRMRTIGSLCYLEICLGLNVKGWGCFDCGNDPQAPQIVSPADIEER